MTEMHPMFATWVRSLHSSGDADETKVREWWAACEAQVGACDEPDVVELVRIAYGHPDPEFDGRWRAHVAEHDLLFPLRGDEHKVSVVAAAATMLASESPKLGAATQLARLCASRAGWSPCIEDLAGDATELRALAASLRSLVGWSRRPAITLNVAKAKEPIIAAINEGASAITPAVMGHVVDAIGAATDVSLTKVLARFQDVTTKRELPLLEQSDVLIWLMRGRSTVLDMPWSEMSQVDAAIAAAVELNSLSRFDLGRDDVGALIAFKVASADKKSKGSSNMDRLRPVIAQTDELGELAPVRLTIASGEVPEALEPEDVGVRLHDELNLARLLRGQ